MRPVLCLACHQPRDRDTQCACGNLSPQQARAHHSTQAWRNRVAQAINREPWCHTQSCPYEDCGTPANPLSGDYDTPLAAGGHPNGPITIRCLKSNQSRGTG